MKTKKIKFLHLTSMLMVIFGFSGRSLAQSEAFSKLSAAKSLVCRFPVGTFANWRAHSLEIVNDRMEHPIHFDSIDLKSKKARMIGPLGAKDVMVFKSPIDLTFIEITTMGNVIYTTVYPAYLENKTIPNLPELDSISKSQLPNSFIAVTSRHLFDPIFTNLPMSAQLHGYCVLLD
jgi:hypothetical protein